MKPTKVKVDKRGLGITFAVLNHVFAWVGPLVFILIYYRKPFFNSSYSVYLTPLVVGAVVALRFIWYRLTVAIEEGVAFDKQLAREVRFLIPMIAIAGLMFAIITGLANLHIVILVVLASNIIAVPFRLVAYRYSKRYLRDIAGISAAQTLTEMSKSLK